MIFTRAPDLFARNLAKRLQRIAKQRLLAHLEQIERNVGEERAVRIEPLLRVPLSKRPKDTFPDILSYTPFETMYASADYHTVETGSGEDRVTTIVFHGAEKSKFILGNARIQRDYFQKRYEYATEMAKELQEMKPDWHKVNDLLNKIKAKVQAPSYISGTLVSLNLKHVDGAFMQTNAGDNLVGIFYTFYLVFLGVKNLPLFTKKEPNQYCGSARYFLDVMIYFIKCCLEIVFFLSLLVSISCFGTLIAAVFIAPSAAMAILLPPILAPFLPWLALAQYETGSCNILKGPMEREIATLESYVHAKIATTKPAVANDGPKEELSLNDDASLPYVG